MSFGSHYDYLVFDLVVDSIPSSDAVEAWISGPLWDAGIEALGLAKHDFESPVDGSHAYTITAVLSASHMAIHTAPEHSWVQVAFALCDGVDRETSLTAAVNTFFRPRSARLSKFRCGVEERS